MPLWWCGAWLRPLRVVWVEGSYFPDLSKVSLLMVSEALSICCLVLETSLLVSSSLAFSESFRFEVARLFVGSQFGAG